MNNCGRYAICENGDCDFLGNAYEFDERYPEIQEKLKHSRNVLREAGADYVIDTLDELPQVIENINNV